MKKIKSTEKENCPSCLFERICLYLIEEKIISSEELLDMTLEDVISLFQVKLKTFLKEKERLEEVIGE
tara:strand:+ start:33 stop:236 length:204 start_codon:yes stop_codon:yes gene_type:complete